MNIGKEVRRIYKPLRTTNWPKERPIPVPNWPQRKPEKVPVRTNGGEKCTG